jgi:superfamily II DNA or RNA helicase
VDVKLRDYQQRAVTAVHEAWSQGARRICLVLPTGAGKTITAAAIAPDALWLVHRRELAEQAPGHAETIQGLLASGRRPECSTLIADECHHLGPGAEQWNAVAQSYPRILGLTATPQRHDGTALGDLFDHLIVGAKYSELIAGGWIMEPKVYRPAEDLVSGLAAQPAEAWAKHAGGRSGFAFFGRVDAAQQFAAAPLGARAIWGDMPDEERADALAEFRAGRVRCLANVQVLTEGVDAPEAEVCLLASQCSHAGAYLQRVGRVLRPAPGKQQPVVIDLPGLSHRFGLPTADREYSLSGRPIRCKTEGLRVCQQCGLTYPTADGACPACGFAPPAEPPRIRIWDVPLGEVSAAVREQLRPEDRAKLAWRERWLRASKEECAAEYRRLSALGAARGYKPGWASMQYKLRTGRWPSKRA